MIFSLITEKKNYPYLTTIIVINILLVLFFKMTYLISALFLFLLFFLIILIFKKPVSGIYFIIIWAFIGLGIKRYLAIWGLILPLGIFVDFLLLLTFLALFFKSYHQKKAGIWSEKVNKLVLLWGVFSFFQLLNPNSNSFLAWFFASRGTSLYMLFTIPLTMLLFKNNKNTNHFIMIWFILSSLGTLWAIKQKFLGLDQAELLWLSDPRNLGTHILHGKLRHFSFYTDAGQFGAAQAHTFLVSLILAFSATKRSFRIFSFFVAALSLYGLLISGTRGALIIVVSGFAVYLVIIKQWKIFIAGLGLMLFFLFILKFTFIGQGIYEIGRLRTALDPNDASFQTRLMNQEKLISYLNKNPFGGGIGSAGHWGQRFNPDTFLSELALDSWYVRIAAETGYPGFFIYIFVLLSILNLARKKISSLKKGFYKTTRISLFCGVFGIMVGSYGNQLLGQMPTAFLIYVSIAIIFLNPNSQNDTSISK